MWDGRVYTGCCKLSTKCRICKIANTFCPTTRTTLLLLSDNTTVVLDTLPVRYHSYYSHYNSHNLTDEVAKTKKNKKTKNENNRIQQYSQNPKNASFSQVVFWDFVFWFLKLLKHRNPGRKCQNPKKNTNEKKQKNNSIQQDS